MPLYIRNREIAQTFRISPNSVTKLMNSLNVKKNKFLNRPHYSTKNILTKIGYPSDLIRDISEDREPLQPLLTVDDFIQHFWLEKNQDETVRRHVRSGRLPAIRILEDRIRFRPFDIAAIERG